MDYYHTLYNTAVNYLKTYNYQLLVTFVCVSLIFCTQYVTNKINDNVNDEDDEDDEDTETESTEELSDSIDETQSKITDYYEPTK